MNNVWKLHWTLENPDHLILIVKTSPLAKMMEWRSNVLNHNYFKMNSFALHIMNWSLCDPQGHPGFCTYRLLFTHEIKTAVFNEMAFLFANTFTDFNLSSVTMCIKFRFRTGTEKLLDVSVVGSYTAHWAEQCFYLYFTCF